ncbi:hypothetical protein BDAP_001425 [Binucleata daphniae]
MLNKMSKSNVCLTMIKLVFCYLILDKINLETTFVAASNPSSQNPVFKIPEVPKKRSSYTSKAESTGGFSKGLSETERNRLNKNYEIQSRKVAAQIRQELGHSLEPFPGMKGIQPKKIRVVKVDLSKLNINK